MGFSDQAQLHRQVVTEVEEKGEALEDLVTESCRPLVFVTRAIFLLVKLHELSERFLYKGDDEGWRGKVDLLTLFSPRQVH